MQTPSQQGRPARLWDVDWLRIISTALIFIYHTARFFDNMEPWHIKNNLRVEWLTYPMALGSQFMMPLFFILSGMATRFALGSRPWREFAWKRLLRLGVPVITLGWFVLSPPQVYIEAATGQNYNAPPFVGSFWQFLPHYFRLPTYGTGGYFAWSGMHLWYLAWLLIFSLAALPLFVWLRSVPTQSGLRSAAGKRALDSLARFLQRAGAIFLPGLLPCLTELLVRDRVPYLGADEGGWVLASHWLFLIYGFILASQPDLREAMRRQRWLALGLAVATTIPLAIWARSLAEGSIDSLAMLGKFVWRNFNGWFYLVAILGFAAEHLNRPRAVMAVLGPAVLPFYILHQPLIVVLGYWMRNWMLPSLLKYLLLFGGVASIALGLYWFAIRRNRVLRFLFGIPQPGEKS